MLWSSTFYQNDNFWMETIFDYNEKVSSIQIYTLLYSNRAAFRIFVLIAWCRFLHLRGLSFLHHFINFGKVSFLFLEQDRYSINTLRRDAKMRYKDKVILMKYSQLPSFDEDHITSWNVIHILLHLSLRNILLKKYSKIAVLFIISKLTLFELWKDG